MARVPAFTTTDGRVLRQNMKVEWRGDGVYLDGRRLSAEEAAPYWDAIAPFTKEDMADAGVCGHAGRLQHEDRDLRASEAARGAA
jgi:hypothetical protein